MFQLKPERFGIDDFSQQPIEVCGLSFVADRSGALYWPAEKALIVADLHLEKGSSRAERGRLLPPYDTRATLLKLAEAVDRFGAEAVIALGDSMHDRGGAERMAPEDLDVLRQAAQLSYGTERISLTFCRNLTMRLALGSRQGCPPLPSQERGHDRCSFATRE